MSIQFNRAAQYLYETGVIDPAVPMTDKARVVDALATALARADIVAVPESTYTLLVEAAKHARYDTPQHGDQIDSIAAFDAQVRQENQS